MKETRFKQTEIGLIPEDWEVVPISKVAETSSGGTPSRDVKRYYKGNIRWITTSELKDSRIYDSIEHITEEAIQNSSAKIFPKGTVLIAMYGATIGKLGILEVNSTTNQACCAIICNDIKNIYLFYYLFFIRKEIILQGCGAGQPNISQNIVKHINVGLPKEIEQNKISSVLTSIDNLLLSLEKQIEKKRLIKQGTMQELLTGKKRLLGFAGEWVEKRLGEIGEIVKNSINPQLYRAELFFEYSMPAYDLNKQPEIKYGEEMFSNRTEISGTILLYNKLNVRQRRIWYIEDCKYHSICSMEFLPYKVYSDYLKFFYYKLSIDSVINYFIGISKGTSNSQKRISPNDFLDLRVSYPKELQEQKAIVSVLSSMDKEIESLEDKKAKYEQIKQGMMQQLLTGKIRLI